MARPVWIDDVDFDLARHLRRAALPAREPLGLESLVADIMATHLDRARPLWELWVVEGLPDDQWAIISKVHHCMVDGIAGTDLLAVMLDAEPTAGHPSAAAWMPAPEPSSLHLARFSVTRTAASMLAHLEQLGGMLRRPRRTWDRLRDLFTGAKGLWLQPRRAGSPLTGPIGPRRRWAHLRVPLADVATIRRSLGGTVNDAVITAVALGFRELLATRGEPRDGRTVMALVPVSVRARDERGRLDNRVAVTHALLPVGIDDPIVAHTMLHEHLDALKRSHETDASTVLLHTGDFTPHAIAAVVARAVVRAQQNLETIATNVPGPRSPLFLCGRRMLDAYPFAPIAGRIRISIAIWSYCGTLYFGVTADHDTVTDLDTLVLGIGRGFERLLEAAEPGAR